MSGLYTVWRHWNVYYGVCQCIIIYLILSGKYSKIFNPNNCVIKIKKYFNALKPSTHWCFTLKERGSPLRIRVDSTAEVWNIASRNMLMHISYRWKEQSSCSMYIDLAGYTLFCYMLHAQNMHLSKPMRNSQDMCFYTRFLFFVYRNHKQSY